MNNVDLFKIYNNLRKKPTGYAFSAIKIDRWKNVYFAIYSRDNPVLFIETEHRSNNPPLQTTKTLLRMSQELRIYSEGIPLKKRRFHMLLCKSTNKIDKEYFIILIDAFLSSLEEREIGEDDLITFFRTMVRLFKVSSTPNLEVGRQGLWGELFLMRHVQGYKFWAPFWHGKATRLFDFSNQKKHIEIKTTKSDSRIHRFSHNQIFSVSGEDIFVASLMLREDCAGLSLRTLIEECRTTLKGTPHYYKLEISVRHVGMEDRSTEGPRFNETHAEKYLLWFKSTDVPHFRLPEPQGVLDTRYKVDLSLASPVSIIDINKWLHSWNPVM